MTTPLTSDLSSPNLGVMISNGNGADSIERCRGSVMAAERIAASIPAVRPIRIERAVE